MTSSTTLRPRVLMVTGACAPAEAGSYGTQLPLSDRVITGFVERSRA